jgi:hypothetical protein
MARTDFTGPVIAFGKGRSPGGIGFSQDNNPDDPSPSLGNRGWGWLDPRPPFTYQPGMSATEPFYGFAAGELTLIDQAPSALAANNIAASQAITAGTAATLVATSGAGITVGASVVNALTGQLVTGLLAIDGTHGGVAFGANAAANLWNPATAISRCLVVAGLTGTMLISGYDLYGYPMTQLVTGAATTLKAFKYVASAVPQAGSSGSALTIGTTDVYGIPLAVSAFGYLTVYWNNALIAVAGTGVAFVPAVTTSPSTNLLGDIRGTLNIGTGTPSNGTVAMQLFWRPNVNNMLTQAGIFGVQQV